MSDHYHGIFLLAARAARRGMFRTSNEIDALKDKSRGGRGKPDPVLLADRRTSMCDYRLALSLTLGRSCDRNGFSR